VGQRVREEGRQLIGVSPAASDAGSRIAAGDDSHDDGGGDALAPGHDGHESAGRFYVPAGARLR